MFHPDSWEIFGRTRDFNSPYLNYVVFLIGGCICSQAAFFEGHSHPSSLILGGLVVLCDRHLFDNLHCDEAVLVAIDFGQATGLPVTSEGCAGAMLDDFCEHLASLIPAERRIPTGMPFTAM